MKWGYNTLRAAGKCGWCGKDPLPGKTLCERCGEKSRAKNKAYHAKKRAGQIEGTYNQGKMSSARLSALGRCARCHLLNPCVCLPTIQEVAIGRRDGGSACVVRACAGQTGHFRGGAVTS